MLNFISLGFNFLEGDYKNVTGIIYIGFVGGILFVECLCLIVVIVKFIIGLYNFVFRKSK